VGKIVYVTGGRRSGKSAFAQGYAERIGGARVYIATCPALDEETRARVDAHKKAREGKGWMTIEETADLAGAIAKAQGAGVALVECLTLWVNNILYQAEQTGTTPAQETLVDKMAAVLRAARGLAGTAVFVSNEVGWGIIPDNALARRFSDMAGMVNQLAAGEADEAYIVISGIAQKIK
jgi:adenosylcobinamide kinase/adenosylcobinamide-phosphate guanylyltransferase